jgi:hypothetical protein
MPRKISPTFRIGIEARDHVRKLLDMFRHAHLVGNIFQPLEILLSSEPCGYTHKKTTSSYPGKHLAAFHLSGVSGYGDRKAKKAYKVHKVIVFLGILIRLGRKSRCETLLT